MESAVAVQAKGRAWGWYCATKVSIWRTKSFTWRNDPRRIARGATDVHGPSSSSFLPIDMKIRPVAKYIKLFIGRDTSRLLKNSACRPACSAGRLLKKISDARRATNRRAPGDFGSTFERGGWG